MATHPQGGSQKMSKRSAKLLLLLVALVCGCAAVPATKYYRVPTDISAACDISVHSYQESLRVARFDAIAPLSQDSIVTYQEGSALIDFSPHAYWESSPSDIVTDHTSLPPIVLP